MERMNSNEAIISMPYGPNAYAKRYKGFNINGFKFHKKVHETHRQIQNFGVVVEVTEMG